MRTLPLFSQNTNQLIMASMSCMSQTTAGWWQWMSNHHPTQRGNTSTQKCSFYRRNQLGPTTSRGINNFNGNSVTRQHILIQQNSLQTTYWHCHGNFCLQHMQTYSWVNLRRILAETPLEIILYKRYIDDILIITTSTQTQLNNFLHNLNTFHPTINSRASNNLPRFGNIQRIWVLSTS